MSFGKDDEYPVFLTYDIHQNAFVEVAYGEGDHYPIFVTEDNSDPATWEGRFHSVHFDC